MSKINIKNKKIIPSEHQECVAFWEYCQWVLKLGISIFHVANEGKRKISYLNSLLKIGLTPGVLDYIYLKRNNKYAALIIDMKRIDARNKKKDLNQEAFIENALKEGYYATYAYGCDDAIRILMMYRNNEL